MKIFNDSFLIKMCLACLFINFGYAVSSSEVSQDLNGLIDQINKVNDDLNSKQKQQKHLSQAINDSDEAIVKSESVLNRLKAQRNFDMKQLDEIESVLPELTRTTQAVQDKVKISIVTIYKQLRLLQSNDSIINGNDELEYNRRKKYLVAVLNLEQQKYAELQSKLDKLSQLNDKISSELDQIDKQLGITNKRKSWLQQNKDAKLQQAEALQEKITQERVKLADLKQQQQQLNKLLQNLLALEASTKSKEKDNNSKQLSGSMPSYRYEDNSPFLSRKLSKPVEGGVAIVKFGEVRGGVPNNGILYKANNLPVHSISNGKVLFSGVLPGFGQIVVIDHGDSYTSIYSGILSSVTKNQQVSNNQIIGSSGIAGNQPMGGVYFELRHLGKPVNPTKFQ